MKRVVGKALLVAAIGISSGALHSLAVDDVQRLENGVHVIDLAMAKRLFNKLPRRKQRGISRNYLTVYAASGGVLTRMRK